MTTFSARERAIWTASHSVFALDPEHKGEITSNVRTVARNYERSLTNIERRRGGPRRSLKNAIYHHLASPSTKLAAVILASARKSEKLTWVQAQTISTG